jgi:hypothetical protein
VKQLVGLLTALLLAGATLGCGGDKDKGVNKDKDRQKPEANNPAR